MFVEFCRHLMTFHVPILRIHEIHSQCRDTVAILSGKKYCHKSFLLIYGIIYSVMFTAILVGFNKDTYEFSLFLIKIDLIILIVNKWL